MEYKSSAVQLINCLVQSVI